ncbi:hypothetical protein RIF29_03370 [Crotalaria pallida]|uniref:Uncharacterized protein n=1 Tax=Crotalaria pallida TaxID=3830 RepID=A0AAN9P9T0_CROPI
MEVDKTDDGFDPMDRKGCKLFQLEDWELCYNDDLTTEICGDYSLLEDEELDDTGTSSEVVESRFVSKKPPVVESKSVAKEALVLSCSLCLVLYPT